MLKQLLDIENSLGDPMLVYRFGNNLGLTAHLIGNGAEIFFGKIENVECE
ncbi:hypothetical protein [Heliorestis acidaminivorans]|nr:hypothetical protein [Heliorestis acidaminivorans]